jgi:hypothetical protein
MSSFLTVRPHYPAPIPVTALWRALVACPSALTFSAEPQLVPRDSLSACNAALAVLSLLRPPTSPPSW